MPVRPNWQLPTLHPNPVPARRSGAWRRDQQTAGLHSGRSQEHASMANKMLIDATHPEETRVVVVRGNRVEEFDFESSSRRQLKGNIYLAKVTRVEPSLQAAFIDYGGNRHGFLAFSEIHPDYYQIPVADRQALIAEEERAHRAADAELDRRAGRRERFTRAADTSPDEIKDGELNSEAAERGGEDGSDELGPELDENERDGQGERDPGRLANASASPTRGDPHRMEDPQAAPQPEIEPAMPTQDELAPSQMADLGEPQGDLEVLEEMSEPALEIQRQEQEEMPPDPEQGSDPMRAANSTLIEQLSEEDEDEEEEVVESVGGGDAMEEVPERMPRMRRQYKIQEVIKRRQIMLVQVVKEERGTKGAALTTYLSLAGRYSVLMPNTARGGGISRKITNAQDRKRLKDVAQDLQVPDGMGVILRTAGANRTKAEIKRDFEYLIRLWETVRDLTLKSTAPTLVYEEGSLIKRSIRDLYNKDIDEVLVAGEEAHREAKEFMRMLTPSHAKNVKLYNESQPIFTRYGIESQLDAMFSPTVQLRSGGYVVLNQTEALVSIDVNSGRATREHHIEDTALKTNLEAAEEIARQLRLRDLAGLIVIDFIDMDEKRNNRAVERRLKDCLKNDRARIQVGRISHFGLLEMSRQRIRTGVLESSTEKCPHCGGTGHMRSVASVTLQLLRTLEELLVKGGTHNLIVRTRAEVALYLLNHKRAHLRELEERFQITIMVNADPTIGGVQSFVIDRGEQVHSLEAAKALAIQPTSVVPAEDDEEIEDEALPGDGLEEDSIEPADGAGRRRRRRRRRRRGEEGEAPEPLGPVALEADEAVEDTADLEADGEDEGEASDALLDPQAEGERRRRRRGRRGGRRRRGRESEGPDQPPMLDSELDSAAASASDDGEPLAPPPEDLVTEPMNAEGQAMPAKATAEPVARPETLPEPERARRGSTIREPAPFAIEDLPAPPPPESSASSADPDAGTTPLSQTQDKPEPPRRTGWWSRRFASNKG
jgi:ribonuclease E